MSRFPFFNRSNTIHSKHSQKPYVPQSQQSLDRSGSLNRFYGSAESAKTSIRGKTVRKLCTLFESSSKKAPESESQSESKESWDSCTTTTPFRLSGTEERIVVYLTSLRGVRRTFEDFNAVRMILEGFRVWVDERDVSMDIAYREDSMPRQ
ncbi:uncharacterized protein LOC124848541 [Vigna umbellata]|uniref:uncharacterized protein LOC124848541 n=1 Tax=Vigna umbellata TaxID=87088 RepID=UPI001F5E892E|nr:uncharacterized protein LOC124848541 [Vigna umbellata]